MDTYRKKRKRFEIPGHARLLTFSCNQRLPLLGEQRERDALADQIMLARRRLEFRLAAWVIMPEHVHLLVIPNPPEVTASKILMAIKRPFATKVLEQWRREGRDIVSRMTDSRGRHRFWQAGGGHDRNVFSSRELINKVEYVHDNPRRRGLVRESTSWSWSSAAAYARLETRWPEVDQLA